MANYIDRQIIKNQPTIVEEDVESVTFYPLVDRMKVKTIKKFKRGDETQVKTETGVEVTLEGDLDGLFDLDKVRQAVIDFRKRNP